MINPRITPLIVIHDVHSQQSRHISTFTEHPDHHRSRPKSSLFNQNQTDYTCNMSHGIMLEPFTNITTFTGSTTSPRSHPKVTRFELQRHNASPPTKKTKLHRLLTFSHLSKRSESKATCFDGYLLPVFHATTPVSSYHEQANQGTCKTCCYHRHRIHRCSPVTPVVTTGTLPATTTDTNLLRNLFNKLAHTSCCLFFLPFCIGESFHLIPRHVLKPTLKPALQTNTL
ncbi:hypothetical protein LXL04_015543 [Taraxacum kok-saghyz]